MAVYVYGGAGTFACSAPSAEWLTARCTWVGEAGRVMRSARCIYPLQLACATRPDNARGTALCHNGCEGFEPFRCDGNGSMVGQAGPA
jgi:hypothetical protein